MFKINHELDKLLPSDGFYVLFTGVPHQYIVRIPQGERVSLEVVTGEQLSQWLYQKWQERLSNAG